VTFLVLHPSRLEAELDREIEELRRNTRLGDPEEEQGLLLRDLERFARQMVHVPPCTHERVL
jgi:hypothetical protein